LTVTGDALAELDVALGFAEVAEELDWVKPEVDDRCDDPLKFAES
jgi:DNA mismatch repair ATPase MutS